jgi:pyruvate dehydrogenase complex dehydrogenase (E1) component
VDWTGKGTLQAALERVLKEEFTIQTKTGIYITSTIQDYRTFKINLLAYYSDYIIWDLMLADHDKNPWVRLH